MHSTMVGVTLPAGAVVVTGAGCGLGRALCIELCARGQQVAGLGRNVEDLQETARRAGSLFTWFLCDIADPMAVRETFREVRSRISPVDVLINNAAVYPRHEFLEETAESFMSTVSINLGGAVACTREALHGMVERGDGRIVNVASFADLAPIPASSAYSVSKGAMRIFTRALVADLAGRFPGIIINDWAPGILATRMGLPSGLAPEIAARWGASLALMRDPTLNGSLWEQDHEVLPPISLARRTANRLLGNKRVARRLLE